MLVPAFETLSGVAEQQRTRRHQLPAGRGTILKAPRYHHRNGNARVALLERMIVGSGRANHILYAPSVALSQQARSRMPRRAVQSSLGQCALQFNSNFRQESVSRYTL